MNFYIQVIVMNVLVINISVYIKVQIVFKKRYRRFVKDNYNNFNLKYIMDEF